MSRTGKNNRFPFLDILGYLKNTHKNPKFGRVRQVPTRELGWEFPGWDLSQFAKFGIFMDIFYTLKYPIMEICLYFFPCSLYLITLKNNPSLTNIIFFCSLSLHWQSILLDELIKSDTSIQGVSKC